MPRKKEKSEIEQAKEILSKDLTFVEVFERLGNNKDFQIFIREVVDKKLEALQSLMDEVDFIDKPQNAIAIHNQIKVLKGIKSNFTGIIQQKPNIEEQIQNLS